MLSNREWADAYKSALGCEMCGWNVHPSGLDFDHYLPKGKYRTRSGKLVHLADMIKGNRYSLATVQAEVKKCRVICANCHRVYTHTQQR
jgi:hypothetical protein